MDFFVKESSNSPAVTEVSTDTPKGRGGGVGEIEVDLQEEPEGLAESLWRELLLTEEGWPASVVVGVVMGGVGAVVLLFTMLLVLVRLKQQPHPSPGGQAGGGSDVGGMGGGRGQPIATATDVYTSSSVKSLQEQLQLEDQLHSPGSHSSSLDLEPRSSGKPET